MCYGHPPSTRISPVCCLRTRYRKIRLMMLLFIGRMQNWLSAFFLSLPYSQNWMYNPKFKSAWLTAHEEGKSFPLGPYNAKRTILHSSSPKENPAMQSPDETGLRLIPFRTHRVNQSLPRCLQGTFNCSFLMFSTVLHVCLLQGNAHTPKTRGHASSPASQGSLCQHSRFCGLTSPCCQANSITTVSVQQRHSLSQFPHLA